MRISFLCGLPYTVGTRGREFNRIYSKLTPSPLHFTPPYLCVCVCVQRALLHGTEVIILSDLIIKIVLVTSVDLLRKINISTSLYNFKQFLSRFYNRYATSAYEFSRPSSKRNLNDFVQSRFPSFIFNEKKKKTLKI